MVIGVDLDDVLGDFIGSLVRYHNKVYGTNLTKDEFKNYRLSETLGCTSEEGFLRLLKYYETDEFKNIKPIPGALSSVKKLKKRDDLVLITSRLEIVKEFTLDWVKRNFPGMFSEIYFTYNHYTKTGNGKKKSDVCLERGIEILIEDSLDYSIQCSSNGTKVLLLDQPWNQGQLPENVTRVYSWKEIVEKISYFTSKNIEF